MHAGKTAPRHRNVRTVARPSRLAGVTRLSGRGLMRVAEAIASRPLVYGGAASFVAIASLISTNAFYGQPFGHPQPMLATRGFETQVAMRSADAPTLQPQVWRPTNDPRIMSVPLVRDVQLLLAKTGHYGAEIDGRPGQATDRAIRQFQAENELRVDGMATPLLLTQIRQLTGDVPSPDARPALASSAALEKAVAAMETGGIPEPGEDSAARADLVRRIQSGLAAASVAELKPDGILGGRTRAAIRTFQALEGLEVNGEPSEPLLARLHEIGGRT